MTLNFDVKTQRIQAIGLYNACLASETVQSAFPDDSACKKSQIVLSAQLRIAGNGAGH